MTATNDNDPEIEALWRDKLVHGHRTRIAILPGSPRCTVCRVPIGGIGGAVLKPFGRGPSRMSPNLCNL